MRSLDRALFEAIQNKDPRVLEGLIGRGADVNAQSNFYDPWGLIRPGYTPLMAAAARDILDISEILIKQGADIDYQSPQNKGQTALMIAALYGHYDPVNLLIENHANMNQVDHNGDTVISSVCGGYQYNEFERFEDRLSVLEYLLNKGGDINHQNNQKSTCFMSVINELVVHYGHNEGNAEDDIQLLNFLFDKKPDFSLKNSQGETVYEIAKNFNLTTIALKIKVCHEQNSLTELIENAKLDVNNAFLF